MQQDIWNFKALLEDNLAWDLRSLFTHCCFLNRGNNEASYKVFIKSLTAFAANLFLSASGKSAPISVYVSM